MTKLIKKNVSSQWFMEILVLNVPESGLLDKLWFNIMIDGRNCVVIVEGDFYSISVYCM